MGLFEIVRDAGKKLFGDDEEKAVVDPDEIYPGQNLRVPAQATAGVRA